MTLRTMMSISESIALEKELLDKYRHYPVMNNFSSPSRVFTIRPTNIFEQRLNNKNLHRKVLRFRGHPNELQQGQGDEGESDEEKVNWWWEPPQTVSRDFFSDTSMHGLKYLSQPKRHLCERIFWIAIFVAGLSTAGYFIYSLIQRYLDTPVIVQFSPAEIPIHEITFPAVMICSMNKLGREEYIKNITELEEKETARKVCASQVSFANAFGYAYCRGRLSEEKCQDRRVKREVVDDAKEGDTSGSNDTSLRNAIDKDKEITDFIMKHTPNCTEIIRHCRWRGAASDCSKLFTETITEYVCKIIWPPDEKPDNWYLRERLHTLPHIRGWLTENMTTEEIDERAKWEDWAKDSRFYFDSSQRNDTINDTNIYPKIQKRPGAPFGLSFLLNTNTSDYFCPSSDSLGFRIMLHAPNELPEIREFGMSVGMGNEIYMKVIPDLIMADNEIKSYTKKQRKCIIREDPDWKHLTYYNHNTRTNCINECITKLIIDKCNCSYYFFPLRAKASKRGQKRCLDDDDQKNSCPKATRWDVSNNITGYCSHCMAACMDITYLTETTFSALQPVSMLWNDFDQDMLSNGPPEWSDTETSIVHIFFGDLTTLPKVRKALYSTPDLIANIGGLLGLCLGFSILSAIEILYFCTCRVFMKKLRMRRFGSGKQVGADDNGSTIHSNSGLALRPLYKEP